MVNGRTVFVPSKMLPLTFIESNLFVEKHMFSAATAIRHSPAGGIDVGSMSLVGTETNFVAKEKREMKCDELNLNEELFPLISAAH